jgi:LCP family protein required for cell wall assembly
MEFVGHGLFSHASAFEYSVCDGMISLSGTTSDCEERRRSAKKISMTNFQKAAASFLSVVAIGIIGMILWVYQAKWKAPLGPALQIPISTPFHLPPTWTPNPNESISLLSTPEPAPTTQTSLPADATSTNAIGSCGLPSVTTVLAIGSDTRSDKYLYGLADVIRLIRIDTVRPKITVLEFPRDLWVEIPDIADNLNGQDHEKLNQAYLYGNPGFGYTNDPAQGPGLLARTLVLNFGTHLDHYAAVNMRTFVKIVDAVGGIDLTLPEAIDGRTADDTNARLFFPQGENHLNGTRALTLARTRIDGVFQRADHQNLVLCALRKKLTSPSVIANIPDLIKSFQGAVQTDLSPAQLSQLACVGAQLQPENIIFAGFPESIFTGDRVYDPVFKKDVFIWDADYDILRNYVHQFSDGTWPSPTTQAEQEGHGASLNCQ